MAPATRGAKAKNGVKKKKNSSKQQKDKVLRRAEAEELVIEVDRNGSGEAAGKTRKNKPRADRNSNDDAQLRLRLVASVSRKFRLLPHGELGLYIDLAASSKPYMRIAYCGFTKRMLIAVLEALYKVEKAPRLKEFLDKLREGQRKADAAGADDDDLVLECSDPEEKEEEEASNEPAWQHDSEEDEEQQSSGAEDELSEEQEEEEGEATDPDEMCFEDFLRSVYRKVVEAAGSDLLPGDAVAHMRVALGWPAKMQLTQHEADVLLEVVGGTGGRPARAAAAAGVRAAVAEVQDNNRRLHAGSSAAPAAAAAAAAAAAPVEERTELQQQMSSARTLKELATVVQRVASAVASSKDAATAQADLEFAKSLAVDMGGASRSLKNVFEAVQAAIFKVQISNTLNNRK